GGVGDDAGAPRRLAQHHRVGAAGARQRDAGIDERPPEIAVAVGAAQGLARRRRHVLMWTLSIIACHRLVDGVHKFTVQCNETVTASAKGSAMQIQPYLFFDGRCEEAIEFYRRALGAEVTMLMRFKEAPPQPAGAGGCAPAPGTENKVMHAAIRIGETTVLVSDGRCGGQPNFQGFALSLQPANDAEAARLFAALSDGGEVQMPLGKTFFAAS